MTKDELRKKYKEITGNRAFNGWSAKELEDQIAKASGPRPWHEMSRSQQLKEAHDMTLAIDMGRDYSEKPSVIFIKGEPMMIIGDRYVPYYEGELIWQENKIRQEQCRLLLMEEAQKKEIYKEQ